MDNSVLLRRGARQPPHLADNEGCLARGWPARQVRSRLSPNAFISVGFFSNPRLENPGYVSGFSDRTILGTHPVGDDVGDLGVGVVAPGAGQRPIPSADLRRHINSGNEIPDAMEMGGQAPSRPDGLCAA